MRRSIFLALVLGCSSELAQPDPIQAYGTGGANPVALTTGERAGENSLGGATESGGSSLGHVTSEAGRPPSRIVAVSGASGSAGSSSRSSTEAANHSGGTQAYLSLSEGGSSGGSVVTQAIPSGIAGSVGYACPDEATKLHPPVEISYPEKSNGTFLCEGGGGGVEYTWSDKYQENFESRSWIGVWDASDARTTFSIAVSCQRYVLISVTTGQRWCLDTSQSELRVFKYLHFKNPGITGIFWEVGDEFVGIGECPYSCKDWGLPVYTPPNDAYLD